MRFYDSSVLKLGERSIHCNTCFYNVFKMCSTHLFLSLIITHLVPGSMTGTQQLDFLDNCQYRLNFLVIILCT